MGFYDKPEQHVRIDQDRAPGRHAAGHAPDVRVFRTDTPQWDEMVEARRNRRDAWYVHRAGAIDLCNITVPVKIEEKTASN